MHTMVTSSITRAVCWVVTDLLCQDQLMGTSNQFASLISLAPLYPDLHVLFVQIWTGIFGLQPQESDVLRLGWG